MKDIDVDVKDIIVQSILYHKAVVTGINSSNMVNKADISNHNFYIHKKVMTNESEIGHLPSNILLKNSISDVNQTYVFVDKEPQLNWAHECEYRMYNGLTGEHIETISARMPPVSFMLNSEEYEPIGSMIQRPNKDVGNLKLSSIKTLDNAISNIYGERYAILFSGLTEYRHLNDLEYLYRTLIHIYNFKPENITVLNCIGTLDYCVNPNDPPYPKGIWPGDNTPYELVVNGKGSISAFKDAPNCCKERLTKDDFLLIHTNGHGEGARTQGESTLSTIVCMPDTDPTNPAVNVKVQTGVPEFSSDDFADSLNSFPEFDTFVVMMEQCHSGGFSKPTLTSSKAKNTVFSAACLPWKESAGDQMFDPYAFNWINELSDNHIDVNSAYEYAKENTDPFDTPNEADNPESCSKNITLNV